MLSSQSRIERFTQFTFRIFSFHPLNFLTNILDAYAFLYGQSFPIVVNPNSHICQNIEDIKSRGHNTKEKEGEDDTL